jgi:small subunit ribosomal protein S17
MTQVSEKNKSKAQVLTGTVVSSRNHCTIVAIERLVKHPKYGKYLQYRKKYKAGDLADSRQAGEKVSIVPCPPISKEKRFRVL